jgi:hypothetical protein
LSAAALLAAALMATISSVGKTTFSARFELLLMSPERSDYFGSVETG